MGYEVKDGDVAIIISPDVEDGEWTGCLLYTSPSPRVYAASRMPSSA